ncbi:MAG: hypothetical protein Q7R87_01265 [Nanoarchaeota archaeon]|nr:hypothetical protein [Nanoarchaeota archaeon]
MKLGEALAHLKKEKSNLARLISLRKENVYIEKGKTSPFNPIQLGKEINNKLDNIRKLKISIQGTNLKTDLIGYKISIAEGILLIGEIRSKIAQLSSLFREKDRYSFKLRSKDEIEEISQLDEAEIEKERESLEAEKVKLDNAIQITNWKVELVE